MERAYAPGPSYQGKAPEDIGHVAWVAPGYAVSPRKSAIYPFVGVLRAFFVCLQFNLWCVAAHSEQIKQVSCHLGSGCPLPPVRGGNFIITKMKRQEIEKRVNSILMEKMKVVSEKINTDADYFDDLGFNSLEFVELIMELETAFGIEISDDKAVRCYTVGDIYLMIEELT